MTDPKGTIALLVLIPVTMLICLPILFGSMMLVVLLTMPLVAVGLDPNIQGAAVLLFGFGGGLVLSFAVMVFLYRRTPGRLRRLLEDDPPESRPVPVFGHDPNAEPSTIHQRVHALDAVIDDPPAEADDLA
jgi:hypothetical protein